MGLQIGIVGLPNVGKSTLFNALTKAGASVGSYAFTTIEPNVGITPVPDPRLDRLAAFVKPDRVVPTTVQFVDIAGLVAGASRGEGLGNQFLGHIRNVDAVLMMVRGFNDPDIPHVGGTPHPLDDIQTVDTELILADLAAVERRIEKIASRAKSRPKDVAQELTWLEGMRDHLNAGRRAAAFPADSQAAEVALNEMHLLTAKPRLYVLNVAEADLPDGGEHGKMLRPIAEAEGAHLTVISAASEMALADWPADEAAAYRRELGLTESGLSAVIRASYELLGLITFFTGPGGKEVRAWELRRGSSTFDAAGKIHSDIQRGFIRAEVIPIDTLLQFDSMATAREKGLVRVEGRDYIVQDGDVIYIRFSV